METDARSPRKGEWHDIDEMVVDMAVGGYRPDHITKGELLAAITAMTEAGRSSNQIANSLRLTQRTVLRYRKIMREGIPEPKVRRGRKSGWENVREHVVEDLVAGSSSGHTSMHESILAAVTLVESGWDKQQVADHLGLKFHTVTEYLRIARTEGRTEWVTPRGHFGGFGLIRLNVVDDIVAGVYDGFRSKGETLAAAVKLADKGMTRQEASLYMGLSRSTLTQYIREARIAGVLEDFIHV